MPAVDTYLAQCSDKDRLALQHIRTLIAQIVPNAKEVMSYGMPGFKYSGKYLVGYGAFKDHLSLFPTSEPIEIMREELQRYVISKGSIHFSADSPLPDSLTKKLIAVRLAVIDGPGR